MVLILSTTINTNIAINTYLKDFKISLLLLSIKKSPISINIKNPINNNVKNKSTDGANNALINAHPEKYKIILSLTRIFAPLVKIRQLCVGIFSPYIFVNSSHFFNCYYYIISFFFDIFK